jgi:predicted metal-dependent RNase
VFILVILPLGVGGAFTQKYFHANLCIKLGNKHLLLDAGTTLRNSLEHAGILESSIDYIFITHFHHDHVGGLAEFLTKCYWQFDNGNHVPHRPALLLRSSQLKEIDGLLSPALNNQGLVWQDYCIPVQIENSTIIVEDYEIKIINTNDLHCEGLKSCGLKITNISSGANVIVTGDIKKLQESTFLVEINPLTEAVIQDVSFQYNPVHATIEEVISYYTIENQSKIYGIHYEDHINPNQNHPIKLLEQGEPITFKC